MIDQQKGGMLRIMGRAKTRQLAYNMAEGPRLPTFTAEIPAILI